jgi:hypothetical protein
MKDFILYVFPVWDGIICLDGINSEQTVIMKLRFILIWNCFPNETYF